MNKAQYNWVKPDTMILIVRLRALVGFSMGKDSRRQADIGFVPGTATLTPEGKEVADVEIGWLVSHLASGKMPEAVPRPARTGKPAARRKASVSPGCVRAV